MLTLDQLISEADALTDAGISEVLVWKNNALTLLTRHINPHNQPQSVKDFLNAIRQVCPPKPTT